MPGPGQVQACPGRQAMRRWCGPGSSGGGPIIVSMATARSGKARGRPLSDQAVRGTTSLSRLASVDVVASSGQAGSPGPGAAHRGWTTTTVRAVRRNRGADDRTLEPCPSCQSCQSCKPCQKSRSWCLSALVVRGDDGADLGHKLGSVYVFEQVASRSSGASSRLFISIGI